MLKFWLARDLLIPGAQHLRRRIPARNCEAPRRSQFRANPHILTDARLFPTGRSTQPGRSRGETSRFGIVLSQKVMAQAVAVVGALGGTAINLVFIEHFQDLARGHFTVSNGSIAPTSCARNMIGSRARLLPPHESLLDRQSSDCDRYRAAVFRPSLTQITPITWIGSVDMLVRGPTCAYLIK